MSKQKPNEYVKGQFRRLMENIELDVSKQDKVVDEACIAIDSAFEQGKLAGKKELVKHLCRIWWTEFNQNWDYTECCEWLKSQLSQDEAKK